MIAKPEPIEPSEFDLVVLGTELVESLVAAAAAKAGKSVLQLDAAGTYGGNWTSLSLQDFLATLGAAKSADEPAAATGPFRGCSTVAISGAAVLECPGLGDSLGPSSQYNIDLSPKVLYGAGPLIDLLLGSGAHNYTEFKLVQGSYLLEGQVLRPVPATRSEVFKDRSLSLAQKRALMKFLKACSEALAEQGPLQGCFDERPFALLMREQGLDMQLQALLLHAVLMQDQAQRDVAPPASGLEAPQETVPPDGDSGEQPPSAAVFSAAAALKLMGIHLGSVGRYGQDAGPFLTPMYGCGELPQAFCRVAAVAGAIQVLRCPIEGPIFDEHTFSCVGVELGTGQVIRCQHLAASQDYLQEWLSTFHPDIEQSAVHRCSAVLDSPLVPCEQQSLLVLPPGAVRGAVHAVRGLALSSSTKASPSDRYLLHLWTPAAAVPADRQAAAPSAVDVLRPALELLGLDVSGLQPQQAQQQETPAASGGTVADGEARTPLQEQQQQAAAEEEAAKSDGSPAGAGADSSDALAACPATHAGIAGDTSELTRAEQAAAPPASEGASPAVPERQAGPKAVMAAFYMQHRTAIRRYTDAWPHNTVLCPGPDHTATFLSAVEDAKACFTRLYPEVQPFPLEQPPGKALLDDDSDEEAVGVLEAVLGRLPTGGGGSGSVKEEQQPVDGIMPGQQGGEALPGSRQL
ncbi:hypothetical protein N2152v2_009893 [Parachlorella kessleri]